MATLLIAGPSRLEDHDARQGLIGGNGAVAAMAAAPLVHTQLWSRGGDAFDTRLREILTRRAIDLAGFGSEGDTARETDPPDGQQLPEVEPVAAEGLTVVLEAGLGPRDSARCRRVLARLGAACLRVVMPPTDVDREDLLARADCDLLIVGVAQCRTILQQEPVAAADTLRAAGARAVALCAGPLGGLLAYKQKRATWAAIPAALEPHASRRALFAGVLSGMLADHGHLDFRNLKRQTATAGAVAASCGRGAGPLRLLAAGGADYQRAFLQLRRNNKA